MNTQEIIGAMRAKGCPPEQIERVQSVLSKADATIAAPRPQGKMWEVPRP